MKYITLATTIAPKVAAIVNLSLLLLAPLWSTQPTNDKVNITDIIDDKNYDRNIE